MTCSERIARAKANLSKFPPSRPVWVDCAGDLRLGRSSDFVEMLEALGVRTRS